MKNGKIDPLTSSIDLCINKDLYTSFRTHVKTFQKYLLEISKTYGLKVVKTNRNYEEVHKEIIKYVREVLK
jgi:hypothetical protein